MKALVLTLSGLLLAVAVLDLWVRYAPLPRISAGEVSGGLGDFPEVGGFSARRALTGPPADTLARLDRIILATPHTRRLAGAPETDVRRYVTRSRFWGFPDLTLVQAQGNVLQIHGHLVFGRSDFGVNRARILTWLKILSQP